jgi:hypothetical protein
MPRGLFSTQTACHTNNSENGEFPKFPLIHWLNIAILRDLTGVTQSLLGVLRHPAPGTILPLRPSLIHHCQNKLTVEIGVGQDLL